ARVPGRARAAPRADPRGHEGRPQAPLPRLLRTPPPRDVRGAPLPARSRRGPLPQSPRRRRVDLAAPLRPRDRRRGAPRLREDGGREPGGLGGRVAPAAPRRAPRLAALRVRKACALAS